MVSRLLFWVNNPHLFTNVFIYVFKQLKYLLWARQKAKQRESRRDAYALEVLQVK